MKYRSLLAFTAAVMAGLVCLLPSAAPAASTDFTVVPFEFDPAHTSLVASGWRAGIGCPTAATISVDDPATTDVFDPRPEPFADPGCPTGDRQDSTRHEGLLLVKTGPTANNASAGADLKGVKGTVLMELGYDIRKPGPLAAGERGSHCGAGAPRFSIVIEGERFVIGCNSPPGVVTASSEGWIRLRWGGSTGRLLAFGPLGLTDITGEAVESIAIIFDEGQDAGPDNFGLAVLDNIDVNGTLVGRGSNAGK